jgi:hypothetical protein
MSLEKIMYWAMLNVYGLLILWGQDEGIWENL